MAWRKPCREDKCERCSFRNKSVHEFCRLKALSTLEHERYRAFPERVGPRILSLESVQYFGTSEYFSENFDGEAISWLLWVPEVFPVCDEELLKSVVHFLRLDRNRKPRKAPCTQGKLDTKMVTKAAERKLIKFFFPWNRPKLTPIFSYTVSNGIKPLWDELTSFADLTIFYPYFWLSSDVTDTQTPKSQGLVRFYLHLAKDPLKINVCASFQRDSVFRLKYSSF